MMYWVGKLILWLGRWKITGEVPDLKQYVIILAPHTSNWDFVFVASVKYYLRLEARFLGKAELFRPPFGWFFRALGGYPVDRSQHNRLVDFVVSLFRENPVFAIGLAPEGTRKYVPNWKTGFWHMAHQADVPIVMAGLDYASRRLVIREPFRTTGDLAADMEEIMAFFRPFKGLHPDQGVK